MTVACGIATTANLVGTYAPGSDANNPGFGATFTMTATGITIIDNVSVGGGGPVLIKNQTSAVQNGIYICTTPGSTGVRTVFTRSGDFAYPGFINNYGPIPVLFGDINSATSWVSSAVVNTVGLDSIIFANLSNSNIITAPTAVTTATYTMLASDQFLVCNRAGTIGITLVSAVGLGLGRRIIVKDNSGAASTNNITITSSGANIDGAATYVISTNYGSITLIYNGTQWNVT